MSEPAVYMLAGPNGAGKTTVAMKLLPDFLSIYEFVNADEIARGLNPLKPESQSMEAGRLMLQRIDALIEARKSFAFETTGSSHVFADKLGDAKKAGYKLGLIYLWLPNAEMAKKRVQQRVAMGGHGIPDSDIERRFSRSLRNLINLYLPLVDEAAIYDSTKLKDASYEIIMEKVESRFSVYDDNLWFSLKQLATKVSEND